MKQIIFLGMLFVGLCLHNANAQTITLEMGKDTSVTSKDNEVKLYNFSNELLNSVENCLLYREDFTENNPDLKKIGDMFGSADFQVFIDIRGWNKGMCDFVITQKIVGFEGTQNVCSVDKEVLSEIVEAMKDRSKELKTETFFTKSQVVDENGKVLDSYVVKNTVVGSSFDIVYSKVVGNYCEVKEVNPSIEEQEEIKEKTMDFSDKFKLSLKECLPDEERRNVLFLSFEAKIMGKKDDKCHIRTNDFDFYLSKEQVVEIGGFDELYKLINDKKSSRYRVLENYYLSEFFGAMKHCSEKSDFNSGVYEDGLFGDVKIKKSIEAKYVENKCVLRFMNRLMIENEAKDYSLKCVLSDKNRDVIISKYGLGRYDEKKAKTILVNLIKKKICKRVENSNKE